MINNPVIAAGFFFWLVILFMKKPIFIIIIAILTIAAFFLVRSRLITRNMPAAQKKADTPGEMNSPSPAPADKIQSATIQNNQTGLVSPIGQAGERITKKPFSIFITPQNSPVQPERFSGYHTGVDFETFPEEQNSDVPIRAITQGKILAKRFASGYGGILVESAVINNNPVTIIYGHLNLASINKSVGDSLNAGEQIGLLGKGFSSETDGERKHLHLGIYKGTSINILGYAQSKNQLSGWLDPCSLEICQ